MASELGMLVDELAQALRDYDDDKIANLPKSVERTSPKLSLYFKEALDILIPFRSIGCLAQEQVDGFVSYAKQISSGRKLEEEEKRQSLELIIRQGVNNFADQVFSLQVKPDAANWMVDSLRYSKSFNTHIKPGFTRPVVWFYEELATKAIAEEDIRAFVQKYPLITQGGISLFLKGIEDFWYKARLLAEEQRISTEKAYNIKLGERIDLGRFFIEALATIHEPDEIPTLIDKDIRKRLKIRERQDRHAEYKVAHGLMLFSNLLAKTGYRDVTWGVKWRTYNTEAELWNYFMNHTQHQISESWQIRERVKTLIEHCRFAFYNYGTRESSFMERYQKLFTDIIGKMDELYRSGGIIQREIRTMLIRAATLIDISDTGILSEERKKDMREMYVGLLEALNVGPPITGAPTLRSYLSGEF